MYRPILTLKAFSKFKISMLHARIYHDISNYTFNKNKPFIVVYDVLPIKKTGRIGQSKWLNG